jgi:hypothetical protein
MSNTIFSKGKLREFDISHRVQRDYPLTEAHRLWVWDTLDAVATFIDEASPDIRRIQYKTRIEFMKSKTHGHNCRVIAEKYSGGRMRKNWHLIIHSPAGSEIFSTDYYVA